MIVWSSYRWTGSGLGMSVIWSWSNQAESGTRYMPAFNCYLLAFWRCKCRMHALSVRWRKTHSMLAVMSITFFCGWCEMWFVWNKQKQQSKCYTWTQSSSENVQDLTKVMMTGDFQDQDLDLYYHYYYPLFLGYLCWIIFRYWKFVGQNWTVRSTYITAKYLVHLQLW